MPNLQTVQVRLDELLEMRWTENPKLHATDLIEESIRKFGFNDPPEIDTTHKLLVVGHGRIELLEKMRVAAPKEPPKNISIDPDDGMWLIPAVLLEFDEINKAYLYAIAHNRSNSKDFHGSSWKVDKIEAMKTAGQLELLGFDNLKESELPKFELPELKPFDASALPDAPGIQIVAPQSFVLMITFPSQELMRSALEAFTYGERKTLPQAARLCSVEGGEMLEKWKNSLRQIETTSSPPTVLATQFGIDGIASDKQVEAVAPQWDTHFVTQEDVNKLALETIAKRKKAETQTALSVGGLCKNCGGSGFIGSKENVCVVCSGKGEL